MREPNPSTKLTLPVAHDFISPWCWIAFWQTRRLKRELGVEIEWLPYETFPLDSEWPDDPGPEDPGLPTRLDLMLALEGLELPKVTRNRRARTHWAHEAGEFAKTEGKGDQMVSALYSAYWEAGRDIGDAGTVLEIARGVVRDLGALEHAIRESAFANAIRPLDPINDARGVVSLPTFLVGGESLRDPTYAALSAALGGTSKRTGDQPFPKLEFPAASSLRPYVLVDMVATIDGKTVSGDRDEDVMDLGSAVDKRLMQRLQECSDAVLLGAGTLRASPKSWNPRTEKRIVVSRSGEVPVDSEFLSKGQPILATGGSSSVRAPKGVKLLRAGGQTLDFAILLNRLRTTFGIERLLVLGGSEVNAELLRRDLVDELFLTVAPKVKLGRKVPTYAGGEPLDRQHLLNFELVDSAAVGSEVFLRYRRAGILGGQE